MLTLSEAFSGGSPEELFYSIEHSQPKPIGPSYSRRLREICMKLLAKSAELRPQIDDVLAMFPSPPYSVPIPCD